MTNGDLRTYVKETSNVSFSVIFGHRTVSFIWNSPKCNQVLHIQVFYFGANINETVPSWPGHWSVTIELVKLNNQVWLYSLYFCKLCPHLVALFSGDYFTTFNSLILIEEIHFEKNSVVTFHINCYYVLSQWYLVILLKFCSWAVWLLSP